jgi:formamidopyrimidine-DNA glycosylase
MPELPEVETIRRQLNSVLVGRVIRRVEVFTKKSIEGNAQDLVGWEVERVFRKSKIIEIYFLGKERVVIVHLKMTGQLVFDNGEDRVVGGHPTADWVGKLPSKHTRVIIEFMDGSKLFFNDMRRFGWMKIVEKEKYEKELRKAVPDVVDKEFSCEYLEGVFEKSKKSVKLVLMDQDKIGGVGNIYANDALYLAKVMPDRRASSLTKGELKRLWSAVRFVIGEGIKYGGASAANYVDSKGLGGTYQDHFLVYKKDGQECSVCGGKIRKMRIGGRGSFYCPRCQK